MASAAPSAGSWPKVVRDPAFREKVSANEHQPSGAPLQHIRAVQTVPKCSAVRWKVRLGMRGAVAGACLADQER